MQSIAIAISDRLQLLFKSRTNWQSTVKHQSTLLNVDIPKDRHSLSISREIDYSPKYFIFSNREFDINQSPNIPDPGEQKCL
jgi:hypothetical protein